MKIRPLRDRVVVRRKEEEEEVRQTRDPLARFEERVVSDGLLVAEDLRTIDGDVVRALDAAVEYAQASPLPEPEDVLTDVYVRYE